MVLVIKFKEKKLFLHKTGNIYYISKDKRGALDELPEGYEVAVNKKSNFPYIKRIK